MPSLKDLSCSIELSGDQGPLQEYGTVYGDAVVETFLLVPKKQQTFTIHLSSQNFIAPGIAMFVFIDGVYQCNRNRQNLKFRQPPDRRSLVDFRVRQKEEKQKDGLMIASEWTFEKPNHASADGAPTSCSPNLLDNADCIEVIVLRCAGPRNDKMAANMNLDGATDWPDYRLDRDSRSRSTAWDDRDPFISTGSNKHGLPPPPPVPSYRSPYAETVQSRQGTAMQHQRGSIYSRAPSPFAAKKAYSRFSEPVSPGTRPRRDIPTPGFQYGSGPLPPHSRVGMHRELVHEAIPGASLGGAPTVDPTLLEKIVREAVRHGVEKSRNGSWQYEHDIENSSHVPGAWSTSPTRPEYRQSQPPAFSAHCNRDHDHNERESTWEQHSSDRKHCPARSRAGTRVAWGEELAWDKQSRVDGWSPPDKSPTDSWEVGETWSKKPSDKWEEVRRRSRSRGRITRSPSPFRRTSHASNSQQSSHSRSQRTRTRSRAPKSHWLDDMRSSSEDNDGWAHVNAASDSTTSIERSDSTLQPSHSRSQAQSSRSKWAKRSSQRGTAHLTSAPHWHPESAHPARPASLLVTNAPTLPSNPPPNHPTVVPSRKQSTYTQPPTPLAAPPPTWGCASETGPKDTAAAAMYPPPAPFSTAGKKHGGSQRSTGSSSWGVTVKAASGSSGRVSWGGKEKTRKAWSSWSDAKKAFAQDEEQPGGRASSSREFDSDRWSTSSSEEKWSLATSTPAPTQKKKKKKKKKKKEARADTASKHKQTNVCAHGYASKADKQQSQPAAKNHADAAQHHLHNAAAACNTDSASALHAQKNKVSHVLCGAGTRYGHAVNRPLYLDDLKEPYALFRFKYGGVGEVDMGGKGWTEEWMERYM